MKLRSKKIAILGLARQSVRIGLRLWSLSVLEFRFGTLRPPRGGGGLKRAAHSAGPIAHCFVGWFARDGRKQIKKRQHIETSAGSPGTVAIWNSMSGYLSVCLPVCPSVCLYLSVYLSVCLLVCLSVSGLKTCGRIQIFGQNRTNVRRKSFQNPSQIYQEYRNMGPGLAFGAESRPVRHKNALRTKNSDFFTPLCAKMSSRWSLLGFP